VSLPYAESGAKGGRAVRWRKQPCRRALLVGFVPGGWTFACQCTQTWKGDHALKHHHRWQGEVDGQQVTVTWSGP
jgi:hypothetical protein